MNELVTIKVRSATRGLLKYLSGVRNEDMIVIAHEIILKEFTREQRKIERRIINKSKKKL